MIAKGPCARLAFPLGGGLAIVERGHDGVVRRGEWHPRRLKERLARIDVWSATHDEIDRIFDGNDLLLPMFARGASRDLRPFGTPFSNAGNVSILLGAAERAREEWPDDDALHDVAVGLETAARVCLKYGMAIRFHY